MSAADSGDRPAVPHPWEEVSGWWQAEIANDPTYDREIAQLVRDLVNPAGASAVVLDVGCGDGRLADVIGTTVGVDISLPLLREAVARSPVARVRLPDLGAFRDASFDGAVVCLVLEHLARHEPLFRSLTRVVCPGGTLVLVANHPIFTAPESAPIQDHDGEHLWRPGRYFGSGYTDEPAGPGTVRFHHRTMSSLLNAAAAAGWSLERLVEYGPLASQIEEMPLLESQRHIPRLLGVRWRRR